MKHKIGFLSPIVALLLCVFSAFPTQAASKQLTDKVSSKPWWQRLVENQVKVSKNKQYDGCLFGDSISSGVGNTLGKNNYNFAIGGLSTVSLVEQLKRLTPSHMKCQKAIVAIGTNDAMNDISNDRFIDNLTNTIILLRSMGTRQIVLIPAFYSTVAASYNPHLAGTIARVEQINELIRHVAVIENVAVDTESIEPLFKEHALKRDLTTDGVHLNQDGIKIYRQALSNILSSNSAKHPDLRQFPQPLGIGELEEIR